MQINVLWSWMRSIMSMNRPGPTLLCRLWLSFDSINHWQSSRGLLNYCHTARIHTRSLKATAALKLLHTSCFKLCLQCCRFQAKNTQEIKTKLLHQRAAVSTENWPFCCQHWNLNTTVWDTAKAVSAQYAASHQCTRVCCWEQEADGSESQTTTPEPLNRYIKRRQSPFCGYSFIKKKKRLHLQALSCSCHCQRWKHPHPVSAHKDHTSKFQSTRQANNIQNKQPHMLAMSLTSSHQHSTMEAQMQIYSLEMWLPRLA